MIAKTKAYFEAKDKCTHKINKKQAYTISSEIKIFINKMDGDQNTKQDKRYFKGTFVNCYVY